MNRSLKLVTPALGIMLAWCLGGENTLPVGSHCTTNDECDGSLVCGYGRCRAECDLDIDCPDDNVCIVGDDSLEERVCTTANESDCSAIVCPGDLECGPDELCREGCLDNEDCGDRWMCVLDFCMATTGSGLSQVEGIDGSLADFDGNGCVDLSDLGTILSAYDSPSEECPECDIDANGDVDGPDLRFVLAFFGVGC